MTTTTAPSAPSSAAEEFEQRRRSPLQRLQLVLHRRPELSPAAVLLVAVIIFGLVNERFWQPANLSLVLQQVAVVAALAVGQTLIILTAGIDLSVGAVMILATVVIGYLVSARGAPGWLALLVGIVVGTGAGLLNGFLVTRIRLPPFIVTLGTLNILTAIALLVSGGISVPGSELGGLLTFTGTSFPVGPFRVTTGVLVVLALYAVVGFALRQTAWGRHVYAVGDDAEASRLAGISVNRVLLSVYTIAGLIFGLTAWVLIGRAGSASPNAGVEANLDSITAVVIGGTSLFGGRGSLLGTLLGAITVGVFRNGLALAGVDVLYQTLVVGVLVIAAVAVDQWIRRVKA